MNFIFNYDSTCIYSCICIFIYIIYIHTLHVIFLNATFSFCSKIVPDIYLTELFYHVYFLNFTDPEADKEATRLLTVNAENLMTAVGVVLNTTESALIKVPPEVRAHLTGLSWVKKMN